MNQAAESFVRGELARIFREVFEEPDMPVDFDTSREQIPEWDSVAQVKLVLLVEETFGIELQTDGIASINTAGGFVKAVESSRA